MTNILLTGAGAPGGPGIIRALGADPANRVTAVDINPHASGRWLVEDFVVIPEAGDPAFLPAILHLVENRSIDVVIPLVTRELVTLATHKADFERFGAKLISSARDAIEVLNDKGRLYALGREAGLPLPRHELVTKADDLLTAVDAICRDDGRCVIKPCLSNGSRGLRIIDLNADRFRSLFDDKPGSLIIGPDEIRTMIGCRRIPPMLVSAYLPGEEVTVDTLHSPNGLELLLIRTRTAMREGISVAGTFIRDRDIEEQLALVFGKMDGLEGGVGFQFKRDHAGRFNLLECNPRLQGTSVAAAGLGINFPQAVVDTALGRTLTVPARLDGVAFTRIYDEIFHAPE